MLTILLLLFCVCGTAVILLADTASSNVLVWTTPAARTSAHRLKPLLTTILQPVK